MTQMILLMLLIDTRVLMQRNTHLLKLALSQWDALRTVLEQVWRNQDKQRKSRAERHKTMVHGIDV